MTNEMNLFLHPTDWVEDGKRRKIIKREGDIALVTVGPPGLKTIQAYEIILIKIEPVAEKWIGHKKLREGGYTHYEATPNMEEFGTNGLCYTNKDVAESIYKEAVQNQTIPDTLNKPYHYGK